MAIVRAARLERLTCRMIRVFLLYRTSDPRISTVLAVAQTLSVKISDLVK